MMKGFLGVIAMLMGLSACTSPGLAVGAGYGVGDLRVSVSSSDMGQTVTPGVSLRSGRAFGVVAGPSVRLFDERYPAEPSSAEVRTGKPDRVVGEAAPEALPEGQE